METDLAGPRSGTRLSFTNHPAFHLLSFLVGILGVVLAVFFYVQGQRERKPLYVVHPTRNIIVNRALSVGDKLAVLYDGQSLNAQNVTALQCTLWNDGSEPIRASDVLTPVKLTLPVGSEILDISVVRQTRPLIVDFHATAEKGPHGERTNSAALNFSILEKGDGATLQLVYIGAPDAVVTLDGTVIGAQLTRVGMPLDFGDQKQSGTQRSRIFEQRFFKLAILAYWFMPFFMALPAGESFRRLFKTASSEGPVNKSTSFPFGKEDFRFLKRRTFWIVQGIWTVFMLVAYYYLFYRYPQVPPKLLG